MLSRKEYGELLKEAFDSMVVELDTHGNTPEFQSIRRHHSHLLIGYWQARREAYEASTSGAVGEELVTGDEKLVVFKLGVYGDEDSEVLSIERRTPTQKDKVSITADIYHGIDEFAYPPTLESEISFEAGEAPDLYYKAVFRQGRISTFERVMIKLDAENRGGYVKDIRVIDCSILE